DTVFFEERVYRGSDLLCGATGFDHDILFRDGDGAGFADQLQVDRDARVQQGCRREDGGDVAEAQQGGTDVGHVGAGGVGAWPAGGMGGDNGRFADQEAGQVDQVGGLLHDLTTSTLRLAPPERRWQRVVPCAENHS